MTSTNNHPNPAPPLSACCQELAEVQGKTTHYYRCSKCGDPCDIHQESEGEVASVSPQPDTQASLKAFEESYGEKYNYHDKLMGQAWQNFRDGWNARNGH